MLTHTKALLFCGFVSSILSIAVGSGKKTTCIATMPYGKKIELTSTEISFGTNPKDKVKKLDKSRGFKNLVDRKASEKNANNRSWLKDVVGITFEIEKSTEQVNGRDCQFLELKMTVTTNDETKTVVLYRDSCIGRKKITSYAQTVFNSDTEAVQKAGEILRRCNTLLGGNGLSQKTKNKGTLLKIRTNRIVDDANNWLKYDSFAGRFSWNQETWKTIFYFEGAKHHMTRIKDLANEAIAAYHQTLKKEIRSCERKNDKMSYWIPSTKSMRESNQREEKRKAKAARARRRNQDIPTRREGSIFNPSELWTGTKWKLAK